MTIIITHLKTNNEALVQAIYFIIIIHFHHAYIFQGHREYAYLPARLYESADSNGLSCIYLSIYVYTYICIYVCILFPDKPNVSVYTTKKSYH